MLEMKLVVYYVRTELPACALSSEMESVLLVLEVNAENELLTGVLQENSL